MRLFLRFLIAFLAVTGLVALATGFPGIEFGHSNYWEHHGILFLVLIAFFPRLTLIFSSVPFGGLFWWLGWFFAPRLLVAVLATVSYWNQNPFLVVIAWLAAFGGESSEKYVVVQRSHFRGARARRWSTWTSGGDRTSTASGYDSAKWVDAEKE